jgi:endonuclease/exonuclease/phosphatase family metal-dependent hydrolase
MRLAVFNVENLFSRARALNMDTWEEGKPILNEFSKLNTRLQKETYTAADKTAILESLDALGLKKSDESTFVILRQNRGKLVKRPQSGPPQIVAEGRGDWIGWLELKKEAVNEIATRMTARVVKDLNADVLAVVEAEDRIALKHFNEQLLQPGNADFEGIMLIDGNDERGIDVGIFSKPTYTFDWIVSHVDDKESGNRIFSRDCPEYLVNTPQGNQVLVMVNHLKSKGFGGAASSNARRKSQAKRIREVYEERLAEGYKHIAVVGDLNDTPTSDPLSPLLGGGSTLKDISEHPNYIDDGRPGTYRNGTASNKIDYILLSPKLFELVMTAGVERRGVWGGTHGTLFPHYDEMEREEHAASDHAALWVEMNI